MSTSRDQLKSVHHCSQDAHEFVINSLGDINKLTHGDPALLMDAIYALKQSHKFLEDARKEIGKTLEKLQRLGCLAMMQSASTRLDGEWASGTPLVTEQPYTPQPGDENYASFMAELGVSDELLARGTVKPRFSAVQGIVASCLEEGRQIPEALKSAKLIKKFTVVARSKHVLD